MKSKKIRYAVVGLGWIAQDSILPAFKNARKNSELVALVSGDERKLKLLSRKYKVPHCYSYERYDECLYSGNIDAVYLTSPNFEHFEQTLMAARAGIHVLCEKPMAISAEQCQDMIDHCERSRVKLMIAYRLHFERANLKAIDLVQSGKLGEPRFYSALFSMPVKKGNIRLEKKGGGPLFDLGIYCINAARYLFQSEPTEVFATSETLDDERFQNVEEMVSATLRFPGHRLANFTCSFGAANLSQFTIAGTEGTLTLDPAFSHEGELVQHLTVKERSRKKTFKGRDQFAPEILTFSDCILKNTQPEPSGLEGLIDVKIIEAIYSSIEKKAPIELVLPAKKGPDLTQSIQRPEPKKPSKMVHAEEPTAA